MKSIIYTHQRWNSGEPSTKMTPRAHQRHIQEVTEEHLKKRRPQLPQLKSMFMIQLRNHGRENHCCPRRRQRKRIIVTISKTSGKPFCVSEPQDQTNSWTWWSEGLRHLDDLNQDFCSLPKVQKSTSDWIKKKGFGVSKSKFRLKSEMMSIDLHGPKASNVAE